MPIRKMTNDEIRAALLHGAQACIESNEAWWWDWDILPQDGAYEAAKAFDDRPGVPKTAQQAANYLLLVREAIA